VLPLAQLHANVAAITAQLHRIAHHAPALWAKQAGVGPGAQPLTVVNNRDFYAQMDVLSFLRDVGRHARVASMLAKDRCAATTTATHIHIHIHRHRHTHRLTPAAFAPSAYGAAGSVRARLAADGGGLSYAEFTYQLLQAYDFWHLYRTAQCTVQVRPKRGAPVSLCDLLITPSPSVARCM
jgi:tyrosyl-tRNA synthetase